MPSNVLELSRISECIRLLKHDYVFRHCLPKRDVTAGRALSHCLTQVSAILEKEYPCVFKFGFTHCLSWRWHNPVYGYKNDKDKYQFMVAVFVSADPLGAALMEAMLIKEYSGLLVVLNCSKYHFISTKSGTCLRFCSAEISLCIFVTHPSRNYYIQLRKTWLQKYPSWW